LCTHYTDPRIFLCKQLGGKELNLLNEKLNKLGWNEEWQQKAAIDETLIPGRVVLEHKRLYRIYTEHGILLGEVSGKYRHTSFEREDYPAVGDWVLVTPLIEDKKAVIHHLLPRISKFSRKSPGETTSEQIVAVNVDLVFLVMALNQDFNVRRLERYLLSTWESGANPIIVLSKSDLCEDVPSKIIS